MCVNFQDNKLSLDKAIDLLLIMIKVIWREYLVDDKIFI